MALGSGRSRRWLLGLLISLGCSSPEAEAPPDAWVTIRGERIAVEIAGSEAEQRLGLGRRDSLGWNQGMLFVYERPGFYGFWMKDMRFDIDIVWIGNGRIVDITPQVPHRAVDPLPIYRPRQLSDAVLEVPAGSTRARGWRAGDRVEVERPSLR